MAVGVSGGDALDKGLVAGHFGLDPALGVFSSPALPDGPSEVLGGAQGVVLRDYGRAALFPQTPVLVDRGDRSGLTVDHRCAAAADVLGAVSDYRAHLLPSDI